MIFGRESDKKLSFARARAKQDEFMVESSHRPSFTLNPDDLHYSSIYALSSYARARLSGRNGEELLSELEKVASFYNAVASGDEDVNLDEGYWQLAMITYFLLGNYGSAKVASSHVINASHYGYRSSVVTELIKYLLCCKGNSPKELPFLHAYLSGEDIDPRTVQEEADSFINRNSPEEAFFGDLLAVAVSDAMRVCSRKLLPEFSGLSEDAWRSYLGARTSAKILWQAQRSIGAKGAFRGKGCFVQLPTGTGKTKSVELLIRSRIYSRECNIAVVIAPLRALCAEISNDLSAGLSDIAEVKRSSEVLEIDSWLVEQTALPKVIVFTPEKFAFVMRHEPGILNGVGLFVFDEAHIIDEPSRGPGYEMLLSELKGKCAHSQFVLLSAVISNPDDYGRWVFGEDGHIVRDQDVQVTEKSIGYLSSRSSRSAFGSKVSFGNADDPFSGEYFALVDVGTQVLRKLGRERKERLFPDLAKGGSVTSQDLAVYYANRLLDNGASAIFIPKKSLMWPFFDRISDYHFRGCNIDKLVSSVNPEVKKTLVRLIDAHYGPDCSLSRGVSAGILPHYGDLQGAIRPAVEYLLQNGNASCVACTSTLAEGGKFAHQIFVHHRCGNWHPETKDPRFPKLDRPCGKIREIHGWIRADYRRKNWQISGQRRIQAAFL